MTGNVYAVLGETELEIIAWLDGLDMRFAARYAEQALIGRKGLLQHTGFAPDEVKMRVLLHAQWCQPAEELAKLKRIMDDTEPVAFVLGSGEYRGVFVLTDMDVTSTQTDGNGVAIAFEAEMSLVEYIGDPALPEPPGVIAKGYRIPVGAAEEATGDAAPGASSPLGGIAAVVSEAVSAAGQVAAAVSEVRSLVSLTAASPMAVSSVVAGRVDGLVRAAGALPVEALGALSGAAAVASEVSRLASAFSGARVALLESAGWLQSDPIGYLGAAADRAGDAARLCEGAAGDVSRLAARVVVRGDEFGGGAT